MPSNQHADILITKDNVTSLASKICFNDGDCKNWNSQSGKMTWQTDESSAELTISKWSMSHRGDYQCIVDNIRSNTLNLKEIMPEQPDTPKIMLNNLRAGEETKINCTSNNGYPSPVIYWYVESRNLTMNSSIRTERNENGRWKATSTLIYTPSIYDHGKELICQVVQPSAAPVVSSQNDTRVLNIVYPPIISLRLLDNDEAVSNMTSVEFECTSDANPKSIDFSWYHNQLIIINSTGQFVVLDRVQRKTVSTSRLIINDVQRMHSGKYECHVITVLGNATATLNFSYCLAELTVALQPPVNLPIMGEDFTMTCSYWTPLPGSVIKWSHDQGNIIATFDEGNNKTQYLTAKQPKFKLIGDDQRTFLIINNLNTDDNGNYTCTVLNHSGRNSSTLALEVLHPAPPSDVIISDIQSHGGYHENSYITMTTGDPQDITCTVQGARQPALIEWNTDVELSMS
ncbi:peroxidasin-like [Lytechinus pictus]|uniref:peroxidasin-like n=1 Tax=Lytechinus pictus TaxID=7653 RepID=UPI0030B9DC4C